MLIWESKEKYKNQIEVDGGKKGIEVLILHFDK